MSKQYAFMGFDDRDLTVSDVARALGASEASVRNWIKTGYLQLGAKKLISRASFEDFRMNVAGSSKLTARANKSQFDSHSGLVTVLFRISEWINSHQGDEAWQRYTTTNFDVRPSALH